jgi:hypothetical protein
MKKYTLNLLPYTKSKEVWNRENPGFHPWRGFKTGIELGIASGITQELNITTEHCRSIAHPFRKSEPTGEPSSHGQSESVLKSY